jgi:hypothetical protein
MKKTTKNLSLLLVGGIILSVMTMNSCNKKSSEPQLPQIGGYNNSNEVASANLLAHWTFDGTLSENKASIAPTTSSHTSFVTGVKGQALNLAAGYVLYPAIPALAAANAIPSVTVSGWVNITNNGTMPTSIFALTQATNVQSDWNTGPVNYYAETGKPITSNDTLVLHSAFSTYAGANRLGGDNINDYGIRETDFKTVKGAGKWVHYVMVYDGAGSNIDIYANGIVVSNNNFRHRTTGSPAVGIGNITTTPPIQALFGAFPNAASGFPNSITQSWQGFMTGSVDELRVYSKALTAAEITALYQLELAGR